MELIRRMLLIAFATIAMSLCLPTRIDAQATGRGPGGGGEGGKFGPTRVPPPPTKPRTPRPTTRRPTRPATQINCQNEDDCPDDYRCARRRCEPEDRPPHSGSTDCRFPARTVLQVLETVYKNMSDSFLTNLRSAFGRDVVSLLNETHARVTVFVPTNAAFIRARNGTSEARIHTNTECLRATLRLHIVLRDFNRTSLLSRKTVGTLQGWQLAISLQQGRTLPSLQVVAGSHRSSVAQMSRTSNVRACNGIVHFINKVLTPPSALPDTQQKSITDAIKAYPELSDFGTALEVTAVSQQLVPSSMYTIFAPTNLAFQQLAMRKTNQSLSTLMKAPNQRDLVGLVRSHISAMPYTVIELAKMAVSHMPVMSFGGQLVNGSVRILPQGSLTVHNVSIVQSNISARNGIIHIMDGVFSLQYPANRCVKETQVPKQGVCVGCSRGFGSSKLSCGGSLPDLKAGWSSWGCRQYQCRLLRCIRIVTSVDCCPGYFGSACTPCPGTSVVNPCSGKGTCNASANGDGKCRCNHGYTGAACDVQSPTDVDTNQPADPSQRLPSGQATKERPSHDSSSEEEENSDPLSGEKAESHSSHTEYFLIPLSIGATLAVLVVIAGIVLWRMKRRMGSLTTPPPPQQQPAAGTEMLPTGMPHSFQAVPGMPDTIAQRKPDGGVVFHATPSTTTMECIPEEDDVSVAERSSVNGDHQRSLSNVSASELVTNQHPMGQSCEDVSPSLSLEATSSNELLDG